MKNTLFRLKLVIVDFTGWVRFLIKHCEFYVNTFVMVHCKQKVHEKIKRCNFTSKFRFLIVKRSLINLQLFKKTIHCKLKHNKIFFFTRPKPLAFCTQNRPRMRSMSNKNGKIPRLPFIPINKNVFSYILLATRAEVRRSSTFIDLFVNIGVLYCLLLFASQSQVLH